MKSGDGVAIYGHSALVSYWDIFGVASERCDDGVVRLCSMRAMLGYSEVVAVTTDHELYWVSLVCKN